MNEPTTGTPQSPSRLPATAPARTPARPQNPEELRLLPWNGAGGNPCFLSTEAGAGAAAGYVARIADRIEAEQMGLAGELLDEARKMLAAKAWTQGELHLLAVDLAEALTHVHRIAESRGARLGMPVPEDEDDVDGDFDTEVDTEADTEADTQITAEVDTEIAAERVETGTRDRVSTGIGEQSEAAVRTAEGLG